MSSPRLTRLARRKAFQCLHRYEVSDWTPAANAAAFGACFTPLGHGHNYELEVYLEGPVDSVTGMILNLVDIDQMLDRVVAPVNGKHLNFEVPRFRDTVPTTEAVAQYLFDRLNVEMSALRRRDDLVPLAAEVRVAKLRLYEYDNLWVDVWP